MVLLAGFAVPVMAAVPYTSTGAFGIVAAAIRDIFHTRARGIMGNVPAAFCHGSGRPQRVLLYALPGVPK